MLLEADSAAFEKAAQAPEWALDEAGVWDQRFRKWGYTRNPDVGLGAITGWFMGGADRQDHKGIVPLWGQWMFHHAPQRNVFLLAGIGYGKTTVVALSAFAHAITTPYFHFTNAAPTSAQAQLAFDWLVQRIEQYPAMDRYISEIKRKPYPLIVFTNGSQLEFRTVGLGGAHLRGIERDWINLDEAGFTPRLSETHTALTGRLRGGRADGTPRLGKLSFTTSPSDDPFLRELWDRGADPNHPEYDPAETLCLRRSIYDNHYLSDRDIKKIEQSISEEEREVELQGLFPEGMGSIFPRAQVEQIQAPELNNHARGVRSVAQPDGSHEELWTGVVPSGYRYEEDRHHGVVLYEKPPESDGVYVLGGDPGMGNPPHRNAGVVMAWNVAHKPYELVYFHWVRGGGYISPFVNSYRYAMEVYQPLYQGMDATGPQAQMHELLRDYFDIEAQGIRFNRDKDAMLNALRILVQRGELRMPLIKGASNQLKRYVVPDRDIAQDIVCALMMCAWLARWIHDDQEPLYDIQTYRRSRPEVEAATAILHQRRARRLSRTRRFGR